MHTRGVLNRLLPLTLALLYLAMLAGHASAYTHGDPPTVVILGSSTAAGANASPLSLSWASRYAAHLETVVPGSQVINLAVGGFTTFNVMPTGSIPSPPWNSSTYYPAPDNNITAALALDPDLIILNLPTNDSDMHVPLDLQISNYAAIIEAAASHRVPVWTCTPQPRTNGDAAARALLRAMVDATIETFADRTIDFWTGIADADGRMLSDDHGRRGYLHSGGAPRRCCCGRRYHHARGWQSGI
jgi:lysophospholipase L1-like esterase